MEHRKFDDIVLKRIWVADGKSMILFQRNNLCINDFKRSDNEYVYEERFKYELGSKLTSDIKGHFILRFRGRNFGRIFTISSKHGYFKGTKDHFGICLKLNDKHQYPFKEEGSMGPVHYYLECRGGNLFFENSEKKRRALVSALSAKEHPSPSYITDSLFDDGISSTVRYAATHPYLGGGISPK